MRPAGEAARPLPLLHGYQVRAICIAWLRRLEKEHAAVGLLFIVNADGFQAQPSLAGRPAPILVHRTPRCQHPGGRASNKGRASSARPSTRNSSRRLIT
jgi:hypothetical protein